MSHDIDPFDHHVAGESLQWTFTVEEDGSAKDIRGATVEWYLLSGRGDATGDAVVDHNTTGVSASITDGLNGEVTVTIDQDVTTGEGGRTLWHRLVVDDSGTGKQIWSGPFPVQEA